MFPFCGSSSHSCLGSSPQSSLAPPQVVVQVQGNESHKGQVINSLDLKFIPAGANVYNHGYKNSIGIELLSYKNHCTQGSPFLWLRYLQIITSLF